MNCLNRLKTIKTENPGSYGLMMEVGNFYYTHAFLGGYGGYIFGDNNTDPTDLGLNNEGASKIRGIHAKIS